MDTDEVGQHGRTTTTVVDAPPVDDDGTRDSAPVRPHRRRILRRALISVGVLAVVLAMVVGGGLWFLTERYAGNIHRIGDVFAGLDQSARPAAPKPAQSEAAAPQTF